MRTQTTQAIRWNREVAQLLWKEKPEMPTPPCRRLTRDAEMTPSEVGTKDHDLRDILESEGIDLSNILKKWKR
jgi:hypothetical protein